MLSLSWLLKWLSGVSALKRRMTFIHSYSSFFNSSGVSKQWFLFFLLQPSLTFRDKRHHWFLNILCRKVVFQVRVFGTIGTCQLWFWTAIFLFLSYLMWKNAVCSIIKKSWKHLINCLLYGTVIYYSYWKPCAPKRPKIPDKPTNHPTALGGGG